jgi:hypothetical protein
MSNMDRLIIISEAGNHELDKLMSELRAILRDGISHGWFDVAISGTVAKNNRREIFVKASNSLKYTIRIDDQAL